MTLTSPARADTVRARRAAGARVLAILRRKTRMSRGRLSWMLVLAIACVGGCALWSETPSEPPSLPAAKMSHDTVVLEIAFVRITGDALLRQDDLWREVDEQQVEPQARRRLLENGLRAGVVSSQLPPLLRQLLEEKADPLAVKGPGITDDVTAAQRQLQSRAGKRGVILAGGQQEKMALLLQQDGRISGEEYVQAQCLFAVKTFPQGDGRVRLELVPEIEHGDARQRWVGQDGAFRVESSKEHKVLEHLRMELLLSPGEVLVLTCTPDQKGLGKQFFASSAAGEQKLLMIRIAQTQYDDVFAPEKLQAPVATPVE